MATYDWTGLGLADNVTLDNTNLNTTGNGTGTLVYQALSGGATRVTEQSANGNGVTIVGPAGSLARLDTSTIAGGEECMAVDFVYKAPATPTVDHHFMIVGRNANATPASTFHIAHTTAGVFEFRNSGNTVVSGGASPAPVTGDYYRFSGAVIRNTLTTPTTSNGRIIGRIRSVTAPGTWNSGAEFYIDTGYTVNVTVDKTNLFRTGKAATAGQVNSHDLLNLRWRDLATPDTSTTKANAITNLVQDSGPTISTTGTGAYYVVYAVGTAVSGGGLSYTITQTGGTTTTPTMIGSNSGIWRIVQSSAGALTYDVQVSESGAGSTTTTVTVPAASTLTSGQFRRRKREAGVLV